MHHNANSKRTFYEAYSYNNYLFIQSQFVISNNQLGFIVERRSYKIN